MAPTNRPFDIEKNRGTQALVAKLKKGKQNCEKYHKSDV